MTQLANVEFGGNRKAAEQWLQEVRKDRTLFGSKITLEQAQAIKNRIQQEYNVFTTSSSGKTITPTNKYGSATTSELDGVYTGKGSLAYDAELDGIYTGPGSLAGRVDDEFTETNVLSRVDDFTETDMLDLGRKGTDVEFPSISAAPRSGVRIGELSSIARPGVPFTTAIPGQRKGKALFADTRTQSPTSIFRDLTENRGFTFKQATDVLNTIVPDISPVVSTRPSVTPASYTAPLSDDSGDDSSPTQDQVQAEADMGLDPFGGAGDPVDNSGGGGGGGDDKIVCTMMNQSYGFGSFRNAIWLKYSKDNLSEEYQKGYHRIFLPLVAYAKGNKTSNKIVRSILEHIARHRTLDLKQEMRGKKRHTLGRIYRSILEPICYIAGKV